MNPLSRDKVHTEGDQPADSTSARDVFSGPGEVAALARELEWSSTPLGPVAQWPRSLRTIVDVVLACPVGMIVLWGPALVQIYNDEYAKVMGPKHPRGLGQPNLDCWPEAQAFSAPLYEGVLERGETFTFTDQLLILERNGAPEETFFSLSYCGVRDDSGTRAGVLVTVVETTATVRARNTEAEHARLSAQMEAEHHEAKASRELALLVEANESARRTELESTNEKLQEQARELELSNHQLHDQAAELESQTEELQVTAEELARTAESREDALRSLLASESRLRMALDVGRLVAWEWDAVNDRIQTTENLRAIYGLDSLETAADGFALVHPDDRERHRQAVTDAVQHLTAYHSQFRITRPDTGVLVWLDERGRAIRDAEGAVIKVIGVTMDISTRKAAEFLREEHEEQLRTLADAIPTLAWTARADGYIDWYNAGWYDYTGTTPSQMAGWGWQSVHHPDVLPNVLAGWQGSIASGEPFEMTFPLRGADGHFRRFLTRVVPVRSAVGAVVRWFGTNTDVESERAAREAAESANQAKTDFLATMSHELRTPLNAIAGYAELLDLGIHGPVTSAQRDAISRIQRSERHLLGLINDVLNFAKLEAGHVEFHVTDVSVRPAIDALESLIAPQLHAKSLTFNREACSDGRVVRADPDKLQQILVNLLSNAIKFTPSGGNISMLCEDDAETVRIGVRDTGIGIAFERQDDVFAPFVQVDRRLNTPQEGTGLGLAISRDLAHGMGGDLGVESELGVGSTFTLSLPRATSTHAA